MRKQIRFARRIGTLACLSGALLQASPAVAQTGASKEQLEEIKVTSQRVTQKLQDVPASVTAFTPAMMDQLQINALTDISRLAPNVKFDPLSGGTGAVRPYIRGSGTDDGAMVTSESQVGMYIDDVYQARLSSGLVDFVELDRIEVLRGPQGVLYGRNSSAGAVNLITRAPSETFAANLEAGIGSGKERRLKGYVSGPLSEDGKVRASLQGMTRARDDNGIYNVTLKKDVGKSEFQGIQGDLAYVGDIFSGRLTVFHLAVDSDGEWPVPNFVSADGKTVTPATGSYVRNASPVESMTKLTQQGARLKLTANYTGGKFTSITGYSDLSDEWRSDFSGGVAGSLLGIPGGGTVALFDRTSTTKQHQFSQELQLAGSMLANKLDYVGGLYYFEEKGQQDFKSIIFFTPSRVVFSPDTTSTAVFGQLTSHLSDRLSVILGGRYTVDDKALEGALDTKGFSQAHSYKRFTPKLGVDYKLAQDALLYASYAEGFRSGGYNSLAGTVDQISKPFLPQYTKALEAGIKADFFDRTLRMNLAGFFNKIQNRPQTLIVSAGPAAGTFVVENYNAEIKGIEFEATWKVAKGLSLWTNGAFNNGKFTSCSTLALTCSVINNKIPFLPKNLYTVGVDYDTPLATGTLKLGADYSRRDEHFGEATNPEIGHIPAYKFLNAYVRFDKGPWSYQLAGKNLTKTEGWNSGFGFALVQPRFVIEPRSVLATVRYKF